MKTFDIHTFLKTRPLSWSAMSSFEYDPEQWFQAYPMGIKQPTSPEMAFGSVFGKSAEIGKPLAPVTLLAKMEHPFAFMFGKIPMIGYADTFDPVFKSHIGEYKTGVKEWTQKRVDEHGQITFYALGNYTLDKVRPEDCAFFLEWIPTKKVWAKNGLSYGIAFRDTPPMPIHFDTKRTMKDLLQFGQRINRTVKEMEIYANRRMA